MLRVSLRIRKRRYRRILVLLSRLQVWEGEVAAVLGAMFTGRWGAGRGGDGPAGPWR
jgi:hypothetical protein